MSLIDPKGQLLHALENAVLAARQLSVMLKAQIDAGMVPNIPPQFYRELAAMPPFEALLNMATGTFIAAGSEMQSAIAPAESALRVLLAAKTPTELLAAAEALVAIDAEVREAIMDADVNSSGSPEQIANSFKEEFILTLTATLTGHSRLLELVGKWESEGQQAIRRSGTKKDYYDFRTFSLVSDPGPGRVHMERFRASVESGVVTFIPGEGIVGTEFLPPLQAALYGQWFTYIHSLWDDSYRGLLAQAFGAAPDGDPWSSGDISSQFFADINNIRNDFVHSKGRARRSVKNKIIKKFRKGSPIIMSTEEMMGLVELFPYEELIKPPVKRAGPVTRTNLAWTASRDLAERFKAAVAADGINGEAAVDQAIEMWLATRNGEDEGEVA